MPEHRLRLRAIPHGSDVKPRYVQSTALLGRGLGSKDLLEALTSLGTVSRLERVTDSGHETL